MNTLYNKEFSYVYFAHSADRLDSDSGWRTANTRSGAGVTVPVVVLVWLSSFDRTLLMGRI
jgi:hypothetical protein